MGAVTVDVGEVICHLTIFWALVPAVGLELLDRWLFFFKLSWSNTLVMSSPLHGYRCRPSGDSNTNETQSSVCYNFKRRVHRPQINSRLPTF